MAFRAVFGLGFATGYVLGARAGRERYESLVRTFRSVRERPAVQGAAGIVAAQAGTLASRARAVISRPDEIDLSSVAAGVNGSNVNGNGAHATH